MGRNELESKRECFICLPHYRDGAFLDESPRGRGGRSYRIPIGDNHSSSRGRR